MKAGPPQSSDASGGPAARSPADGAGLRVLLVAPADPAGPLYGFAGLSAVAAYAQAAAGRVAFTILVDELAAARFSSLPAGHELLVAPSWRVMPRERVGALAAAARLQVNLSCLTELCARVGGRGPRRDWHCVHGFGVEGAPAAAAAARVLGVPWLWSPPAWAPDPAAAGSGAAPDEAATWWAQWAAEVADLLVVEDHRQLEAIRRLWAPDPARLEFLPHGALAGWPPPHAPDPADEGGDAPRRARVALLCGRGATAAQMEAVMAALARLRETAATVGGVAVSAAGLRHGPAAVAWRREARRRELLCGLVWRDLAPGAPLADPVAELGQPDVALLCGGEEAPRSLLAELARAGVAAARPDPDPERLAADLSRLLADRAGSRRARREAWRTAVAPQAVAEADLGRQLARAYIRVAPPAMRAARAGATGAS